MKILLAEDERELSKALCVLLKKNNYSVDPVYDGEEATDYINTIKYDLIILDIMMPKKNGILVLKEMRHDNNKTPVLILSAKSEVDDRVYGLDCGADDYLPKPFNINELLARIRALTRRKTQEIAEENLSFNNLVLKRDSSSICTKNGEEYLLNKEYLIMELLLKNPEKIVSIDSLINYVWPVEDYSTVNNLWVFVSYLRKKLEKIDADVYIKSHRNIGYSLEKKNEKN